jgi:protein CMS1
VRLRWAYVLFPANQDATVDALAISALSHIMLDVTYRDLKQRSVLNIRETRDEVFKTVLAAPQVLEGIKTGKIQVVLF